MKTDPIITKTKFRGILLASLLCVFISTIFDAYDETTISINEALSTDPQNWELAITCILCTLILGILVVPSLYQPLFQEKNK